MSTARRSRAFVATIVPETVEHLVGPKGPYTLMRNAVVSREGKASTSFIQRHLGIGYNRAAKLIEQMEKEGIVSAANHVGKRDVLTRSGFLDELGPGHVWHSIAAGVKAARSAPPIAVVLPGGAVLPGQAKDLVDDTDLDEPENGVHGEQIASKHVDPPES